MSQVYGHILDLDVHEKSYLVLSDINRGRHPHMTPFTYA